MPTEAMIHKKDSSKSISLVHRRPTPKRSALKIWPESKSSQAFVDSETVQSHPEEHCSTNDQHSYQDEQAAIAIPVFEVTVIEDCDAENKKINRKKSVRKVFEAEAREYQYQLKNANSLLDELTSDLNKSRRQVSELINHNTILLEELKNVASRDMMSGEEHRMLRQEMNMLKGCLFFGAIVVVFGGRVYLFALVALVWLVVDFV